MIFFRRDQRSSRQIHQFGVFKERANSNTGNKVCKLSQNIEAILVELVAATNFHAPLLARTDGLFTQNNSNTDSDIDIANALKTFYSYRC